MSLLGQLAEARAELEARHEDPWRKTVADAVRDMDTISTAALFNFASRARDYRHCAPPRFGHAQPALHPDQVAPPNAGRSSG